MSSSPPIAPVRTPALQLRVTVSSDNSEPAEYATRLEEATCMVRRHLAARKGARFDKWQRAQAMGVEEKGDNPSGKTRPLLSGNIPASVSRDLPSGNAFPAYLRMGPLGRDFRSPPARTSKTRLNNKGNGSICAVATRSSGPKTPGGDTGAPANQLTAESLTERGKPDEADCLSHRERSAAM